MIGPDLRMLDWIDQGYVHAELLKNKKRLVLKACPDVLRKELKEINKKLSYEVYVFEEDMNPEDIVFWEE